MIEANIQYPDGKTYTIKSHGTVVVTLPSLSDHRINNTPYHDMYEALPWICKLFLSEQEFTNRMERVLG